MDLTEKSAENIEIMIEAIKSKLQVVNRDVIQSESIDLDKYEELKELYDYVMKMNSISLKEIDGILVELRGLRS